MTRRNPVLAAGMALALAAAGATACSEVQRECTEAGCPPSLQVESTNLPPNQTVEVCVGASCVLADPGQRQSFKEVVLDSAVAEVRVIVRESGMIVSEQRRPVQVIELRPNGPTCPPRCKVVRVSVGPGGFR